MIECGTCGSEAEVYWIGTDGQGYACEMCVADENATSIEWIV